MKSKINIPDQDGVIAQIDALEAEAKRLEILAGSKAPARPAKVHFQIPGRYLDSAPMKIDDYFADIENLEGHIAQLSVITRLQSATPPRAAAPAPTTSLPTTPSVTVAAPVTAGVKLNATQRVLAAIALAGKSKPAIAPALPVAATPARLTATQKCLAAKVPKIAPTTPIATAKTYVPMPPAFTDKSAELLDAQNAVVNTEIGMKHYGKTFSRPALTGDHDADVAALKAYRVALETSFRSILKP